MFFSNILMFSAFGKYMLTILKKYLQLKIAALIYKRYWCKVEKSYEKVPEWDRPFDPTSGDAENHLYESNLNTDWKLLSFL